MGTGRSKPQRSPLHIVEEAHAAHTGIHGVHHEHQYHHTGTEGVVHGVVDFTHELFSKRVQEGDTLWLSEKLGDGNKARDDANHLLVLNPHSFCQY